MTGRRIGGVGIRKDSAPPKRQVVKHLSTAWPPAEFSVHATLIQPACVKCRRSQFKVRRFRIRTKALWTEDCASVCDDCWEIVVESYRSQPGSLKHAFWSTRPAELSADAVLVNLLDFPPHKCSAELWRQFREDRRRKRRYKPTN